jgi:hypothetical protein
VLTFTSTALAGKKKMVVQVTNTGSDLTNNQFDLEIPGGRVGYNDGCTPQWPNSKGKWGAQYGGYSQPSQCKQLPPPLQAGCNWHFKWFLNADNPTISFFRTKCPKSIIAKTGCQRKDEASVQNSAYATL